MSQPSSHRRTLVTVGAVASSVMLAFAVAAPTVAGAATHKHRAKPHGDVVRVESSKSYGKIVVDASGRTLYVLTARSGKALPCTGTCTSVWLPLTTKGRPLAGKGLDHKWLGVVKRGRLRQVTYRGRPLYMFSGDSGSGQVHGEAIASFGGTWYVLGWKGTPVKASLTSSKKGSGSSSSGSGSSSGGGGGWSG